MPFQPIDALDRASFGGMLNTNISNAQAYRDKRTRNLMSGVEPPGSVQPINPGWDAFFGGLMRQDEDAAAHGKRSVVDLTGIGTELSSGVGMPSAMSSLQRRAQPDFDPTEYQMGRANLERTLQDNQSRKVAQHAQENQVLRAQDEGIQTYEEQLAREKLAEDQRAKDAREAESFRQLEPTRALELREKVGAARETLPYNPNVAAAREANLARFDANDAKRDVATTAAGAREGSAAINSLARAAGAITTGDPVAEKRVGDAIGAIQPNVPAGRAGLKPLPPEWDYALVVDKFGGNAKAADDWLALYGYRR